MFGWFKAISIKKQKKLLYQNSSASKALVGYFAAKKDTDTVKRLEDISEKTQRIALSARGNSQLSTNEFNNLNDMNKELREIFGNTGLAAVAAFDDTYIPVRGWAAHYQVG